MTAEGVGFLGDLNARAVEAQAEEIRFRKSVAAEIEARERARAFAFRRLGLMRAVAAAASRAETGEAARSAQAAALRSELGWSEVSEHRQRTLEAFAPVADAIWRSLDPARGEGETPADALAAFETWYAEAHSSPFLALLDQEPMEMPFVEF